MPKKRSGPKKMRKLKRKNSGSCSIEDEHLRQELHEQRPNAPSVRQDAARVLAAIRRNRLSTTVMKREDERQPEQPPEPGAPVPHAPPVDDVLLEQLAPGAVEVRRGDQLVGDDVDQARGRR